MEGHCWISAYLVGHGRSSAMIYRKCLEQRKCCVHNSSLCDTRHNAGSLPGFTQRRGRGRLRLNDLPNVTLTSIHGQAELESRSVWHAPCRPPAPISRTFFCWTFYKLQTKWHVNTLLRTRTFFVMVVITTIMTSKDWYGNLIQTSQLSKCSLRGVCVHVYFYLFF